MDGVVPAAGYFFVTVTCQTIHVIASAIDAGMNQPANISHLCPSSRVFVGSRNHATNFRAHHHRQDGITWQQRCPSHISKRNSAIPRGQDAGVRSAVGSPSHASLSTHADSNSMLPGARLADFRSGHKLPDRQLPLQRENLTHQSIADSGDSPGRVKSPNRAPTGKPPATGPVGRPTRRVPCGFKGTGQRSRPTGSRRPPRRAPARAAT